ncbi:MAG: trehalose-phosphatase [Hyphomonas sp.]|nr:trehalose-phosphatase [Hyphomonas sp.]
MTKRPPPLDAGDAVFLDFDGTLAGLQDDPETVFLAPGLEEVLVALSARLGGALAVISGRDAGDLARRVPLGLWRVGNHGLIRLAPGDAAPGSRATAPGEVDAVLRGVTARFAGARVEVKGPVLALHYRNAPDAGAAIGKALETAGLEAFGYSLQAGKFVFEAKPGDANKGKALERLMQQSPFCGRRAVMIGDDTTDEDAFAAANRRSGLTIKVGAGQTVAHYRLNAVEDVHAYLGELTGA